MSSMKIKKGDLVQVISGRTSDAEKAAARGLKPGDKGKQGKVLQVFPATQRVLVEGVNRITRHNKPGMSGAAGGIEEIEAPIHISNVMLVDPKDSRPTRVGFRTETIEIGEGDAKRSKTVRIRFSKRSGEDI